VEKAPGLTPRFGRSPPLAGSRSTLMLPCCASIVPRRSTCVSRAACPESRGADHDLGSIAACRSPSRQSTYNIANLAGRAGAAASRGPRPSRLVARFGANAVRQLRDLPDRARCSAADYAHNPEARTTAAMVAGHAERCRRQRRPARFAML